jgi:hypothetical protein
MMKNKAKNAAKYLTNPKKNPEKVPDPTKNLDTNGGVPQRIIIIAAFI